MVRARLVRPLGGLPRPRRVSAEAHGADLDRLVEKLAYAAPATLDAVCELALVTAQGKACPDPGLILSWAYAIEPPPPQRSDYVASILRSVMGRAAVEGGYLVELFRHARRFGPPPQNYLIYKLREAAAANARRLEEIRTQQRVAGLNADDAAWLQAWNADRAQALALMGVADLAEAAHG